MKKCKSPAVAGAPDPPCDHWLPMVGMLPGVPKNATWVLVQLRQGIEHTAHWADGGGDDQPPFRGWFIPAGSRSSGYIQIDEPVAWRPLCGTCVRCLHPLPEYPRPD